MALIIKTEIFCVMTPCRLTDKLVVTTVPQEHAACIFRVGAYILNSMLPQSLGGLNSLPSKQPAHISLYLTSILKMVASYFSKHW